MKKKLKEKLKKMKLNDRVKHGYAVAVKCMIATGLVAIIGLGVLDLRFNDYVKGAQKTDTAVKDSIINIDNAARNVREMALNDDKTTYSTYKKNFETELTGSQEQISVIKSTNIIDESLYNEYVTALNEWATVGYDIINQIEKGDIGGAKNKIHNVCTPALNNLMSIADRMDAVTDKETNSAVILCNVVAIIGVGITILFIILAVIISRRIGTTIVGLIMEPIQEIGKIADDLADGNLHTELEYHSDDELGFLAHSLRSSIRTLNSYVSDISRAMKQFSSGDFDIQPQVEWKGDFEEILDSFMAFEGSMADMVKNLQKVADQVSEGSDQVAESSTELAEGATNQAAAIQELTASLTSVYERVSQNSQNAKDVSDKVGELGTQLDSSNGKMSEMVDSMQEINRSSNEISKIIATINDIASQTNLLALNASIEAARAGDAGRGFAVVADQVAVLAAQSAEAAKESSALIESSVKAVENGMVIANDTAVQLGGVVENSKAIVVEVNDIAEALDAQTEAIKQVDEGVEQINDVVQTNSATSEECAAASQQMSSQADALKELISKLKIAHF